MEFEIQDVKFTIEKRNDNSFFIDIIQGDGYDQQCVQFYDANGDELTELRNKINDILNTNLPSS